LNFLSHFYFDQSKSPEFILGVAFPDVVGNFSAHYNTHFKHTPPSLTPHAPSYQFIQGIQRHYEVDGIFHEAPWFELHCQSLKEIIQDSIIKDRLPRLYFIVHVLVELILDRYLIDQNPSILDDYYEKIQKTDEFLVKEVMDLFENSAKQISQMIPRYRHFKEFQFLRLYREDHHLLTAIQKITQYQFQWPLSEEENAVLLQCIKTYYNKHTKSEFNRIFEYVKIQLS
jgi:hypothetical protein